MSNYVDIEEGKRVTFIHGDDLLTGIVNGPIYAIAHRDVFFTVKTYVPVHVAEGNLSLHVDTENITGIEGIDQNRRRLSIA